MQGGGNQTSSCGLVDVLSMNDTLVFAYGSLVNSGTRQSGVRSLPGVLPGWVRQWKHCIETPNGKICALTVAPDARKEVRGLVLFQDTNDLAELDQRESGYSRVRVNVCLENSPLGKMEPRFFTYVGDLAHSAFGSDEFPIWRSYLDCVLGGYFELGGRWAMDNFIASTLGWDAPILDDRQTPKYPRAVTLASNQKREIDEALVKHGLLKNLIRQRDAAAASE
jgi:hypothetical protein